MGVLQVFVTVAEILKAKQHPKADRLKVCMIDTGSAEVQVKALLPVLTTGGPPCLRASFSAFPRRCADVAIMIAQVVTNASNAKPGMRVALAVCPLPAQTLEPCTCGAQFALATCMILALSE